MDILTKIRGWFPNRRRGIGNYTPEQLAELGKSWTWSGGDFVSEQTATDMSNARKIAQNNGYGREAVNLLSNSIISKTGIVVSWENPAIQEMWDTHWWNPQSRHDSFKEQQRRVIRNMVRDGESFVRFHRHPDSLFMEHIDALAVPYDNPETLGITRDTIGRPVSYQVKLDKTNIVSVPAGDIVHTYWSDFSSTRRGISMLRAAIEPLTALKTVQADYQSAVRSILVFRAFVKYTANAPDMPRTNDGQVDLTRLSRMLAVAPDKLPLLPEGVELIMPPEKRLEPNLFVSLKKALLSEAARATGISYFSLASDLEGANFSS